MSVFETSAELKALPEALIQQFDFSEAESLLCLGLVQGKSLDELADESQQSRGGLRALYQRLLEKTGTDTEAKLVSVILSSAELNP